MGTIAIKLRFFLEKMIFNNNYKITEIAGFNETELEEYHERQILNKDVKWIPGQPYWKNRRHTQATKDKISKSLKAKGWKGAIKIEREGARITERLDRRCYYGSFRESHVNRPLPK